MGIDWGETYTYDGYGNMTQMNPSGTAGAPSLSLSVALDSNNVPTNRINATGVMYDNNGNQTLGFGGISLTYDVANRVSAVGGIQTAAYAYDSANLRIYSRNASGSETIYFYGADGTKLATFTYAISSYNGNPEIQFTQQSQNAYFLGKLIVAEGNAVQTDRLGSVRSGGPGGLGYQAQFPYGVEYATTANDREKYATYTRDSATGLDYAMNRYYASIWGRFLSPDPYNGSADPSNPQSWNRYAFVGGDPANNNDPSGLVWGPPGAPDSPDGPGWGPGSGFSWGGGGGGFGGGYGCTDLPDPGQWYDAGGSSFSPFGGPSSFCGPGFLPWGGASGGGGGAHAVDKTFQATDPCNKTAAQVLGDIEQNFGAFANTNSVVAFTPLGVGVGALASSATFTGGPISVGDIITAQDAVTPIVNGNVLPTVTKTATLLVTSVTSNGFILAPQPGAPLTGSITFSFTQTTAGSIAASITLVGDPQGGFFAQLFNSLALGSGGRQVENSIWNNVLASVAADCNRPK